MLKQFFVFIYNLLINPAYCYVPVREDKIIIKR